MFTTALALWIIAVYGVSLNGWFFLGAVVVDVVAWSAIETSLEVFWEERNL